MLHKIELFRLAHSMARHAGARQAVVAENVAHANTPGYKAKKIDGFAETYGDALRGGGLRATRANHALEAPPRRAEARVDDGAASDPNGNSVSIEAEMMTAASARLEHDTALTVYKSAMNILRAGLGR